MKYYELLEQSAESIARRCFTDKTDKQGQPYITHLVSVRDNIAVSPVNLTRDEACLARVTALLHDIIEDTDVTPKMLKNDFGMPPAVIDAVYVLTRTPNNTTYAQYIQNICQSRNKIAVAVKIADLTNNLEKCGNDPSFRSLKKRYESAMSVIFEQCTDMLS